MHMTVLEELGIELKNARHRKGLTQQQLADLSQVSLKHIQLIEKGVKNPSFEVLRAVVRVSDISLDALIYSGSDADEQAAAEWKQTYLSCPPAARGALLNATRGLSNELKRLIEPPDMPTETK